MYLKIDYISIICFLIVLISFFLSSQLLIFSMFKKISNKYLSLFFFILFVMFLYHFLCFATNVKIGIVFLPLYPSLILSLAPTIYMYVLQATDYRIKIKKQLSHYILPLSILLISILYIILFKMHLLKSPVLVRVYGLYIFLSIVIIFPVQQFYYFFKFFQLYKKLENKAKNIYSFEKEVVSGWVKIFLLGYVILIVFNVFNEIIDNKYSTVLVFTCFFLYVFYLGIVLNLKIKRLYLPLNFQTQTDNSIEPLSPILNLEEEIIEVSKGESHLVVGDEKMQEIKRKVLKMIEVDKVFLNPNLSILYFAKKINTNYKYISQVINNEFDKNFFTLINEYRIEYAKELLSNPDNDILTIEAIAEQAGFNSKSAFNASFKKYTGQTPREFKVSTRVSN